MSQAGGRILLIEDAAVVRRKIIHSLKPWSVQFLEASDGDEGVTIFKSHLDSIGMIILDIDMPRQDGVETLKELRAIDKKVPIVMCSGQTAIASIMECAKLGANDFLRKPFEDHVLHAKVLKFMPWLNSGGVPQARRRLLLLEPSDLMRDLLRLMLEQHGLAVTATSSIERAASSCASEPVELVLMNMSLYQSSKMVALSEVNSLRSEGANSEQGITLGYHLNLTDIQETPPGIQAILPLPFRPEEWIRFIRNHL